MNLGGAKHTVVRLRSGTVAHVFLTTVEIHFERRADAMSKAKGPRMTRRVGMEILAEVNDRGPSVLLYTCGEPPPMEYSALGKSLIARRGVPEAGNTPSRRTPVRRRMMRSCFRAKPNFPMTAQPAEILFENATDLAEAVSTGSRDGTLRSAERPESATFTDPEEKPNPELLFAGAYAACFHSAMIGVAKALGTPLTDSVVHARVGQVKDEAGDSRLVVELRAKLPGVDDADGRVLMATAHKICPYSKALRGEAAVSLAVM